MFKILLLSALSFFGNGAQQGEIAWFPSFCPTGWETYVPLEGRMAIGASVDFPLGSTGGSETHILTVDEMPSHAHLYSPPTGTPNEVAYQVNFGGYNYYGNPVNTAPTGGNQPHNNMPPFLALQPCILINATSIDELKHENKELNKEIVFLKDKLQSIEKKLDKLLEKD